MNRNYSGSRRLFGAIVCALLVGCEATPAPTNNPVAPVGDDAVLAALDCYDPVYQIDANARVTRLRLTGRQLSSPVLAEIGKLRDLRNLDLYGTNLTDDSLPFLKNLQKLRSMGLGATFVTDHGLVHLEKLSSLQYVWLPRSSVTPEAVERLKEARPDMNVYLQ